MFLMSLALSVSIFNKKYHQNCPKICLRGLCKSLMNNYNFHIFTQQVTRHMVWLRPTIRYFQMVIHQLDIHPTDNPVMVASAIQIQHFQVQLTLPVSVCLQHCPVLGRGKNQMNLNFKIFPSLFILYQGFPNFSGSAHVTTQTNFSTQVTTLFLKSYSTS